MPKSKSSTAAEEGTAAHEAAALCLMEGLRPEELVGRTFNGFEVDEEMAEALTVYVDYVGQLLLKRGPDATLYVEKPFDLSWLRHDMWGTNDASISLPLSFLDVIDLKYGKGIIVEPEENSQLLYYGLGAFKTLEHDNTHVNMTIVQPRARHAAGPIRTWTVDAGYLWDWRKKLAEAADRARQPNAPLKAGDHCTFCDAAGVCPELRAHVMVECQSDFAELPMAPPPPPVPVVVDDLARALLAVPVVDVWCRAVESAALAFAESGGKLPGFKLVEKKTNRVWVDEAKTVRTLKKLVKNPKVLMTEPKLRGPAQLEKIKEIGKEAVKALCIKPKGGLTIAPDTDPRPEASPPAQVDFNQPLPLLPEDEDFMQ